MWPKLFADGDWHKVAMDRHGYMAFWDTEVKTVEGFCAGYISDNDFAKNLTSKFEVWMGEWAFATDNCAHWLLGFNDATAAHQAECEAVKCPDPYYQCPANTDPKDCQVDPSIPSNGPEGQNKWNNSQTLIENGMCWSDSKKVLN